MRSLLALAALTTAAGFAAAQDFDRQQLRETARLPEFTVKGGFFFNAERGVYLGQNDPNVAAALARIRQIPPCGAGEAERYYLLGRLLDQCRAYHWGQAAYARSAALCRDRLRADPGDAPSLVVLGLALEELDRYDEAEAVLRRACAAAPDGWRGWVALGGVLGAQTFVRLAAGCADLALHRADLDAVYRAAVAGKIPAANAERAGRCMREALDCHDRAAALAPREPAVFVARGAARMVGVNLLDHILVLIRGAPVRPFAMQFPPGFAADLRQAALLDPPDPVLLGGAVMADRMAALTLTNQNPIDPEARAALEEKSRQFQAAALARLERLAADLDPRAAALALECLALTQILALGQVDKAAASLRRCLQLDPTRAGASDILSGILSQTQDWDGCLAVDNARLAQRPSAHGHFLVAKSLSEKGQWREAEDHLRTALALEPDHAHARLGLAAALVRRGDDDALAEAGRHLEQVTSALQVKPGGDRDLVLDCQTTRAQHLALTGDVLQARALLREIVRYAPQHPAAVPALRVLAP